MKKDPDNPKGNSLPKSVTSDAVVSAIVSSGYPLQFRTASILRDDFRLIEEWPFVDTESGKTRTLDILAQKNLESDLDKSPQVRPCVTLLIECKQSELPYVFFLTDVEAPTDPIITGLRHDNIRVHTNDTNSTFSFPVSSVTGLRQTDLIAKPKASAALFSKIVRSGKKLAMSGEEPFNSLVHPLTKSLRYFEEISRPTKSHMHFDCNFALALAVLDAPMVGIQHADESEPMLYPWIRVRRSRLDPVAPSRPYRGDKVDFIDVVHIEYLAQYIEEILTPVFDTYGRYVRKHRESLASGKGYARDLDATGFKVKICDVLSATKKSK